MNENTVPENLLGYSFIIKGKGGKRGEDLLRLSSVYIMHPSSVPPPG